MIQVKCACGKVSQALDEFAGRTVRCFSCKQPVKIDGPAPGAAPPAPSEAPSEGGFDFHPAPAAPFPWKVVALGALGVAFLAIVLAVVAFARGKAAPVYVGDPRDRDDIQRLRQVVDERDREIQALKSAAPAPAGAKSEETARVRALEKVVDDLRAERERFAASVVQAEDKARKLEMKVRELQGLPAPSAPPAPPPPPPPAPPGESSKKEALPDVIARCLPAVVLLKTESGSGAGFFITPEGVILTNYHVIAGSTNIRVEYSFEGLKRTADAVVRAVDAANDLALLQISWPGKLPFLAVEAGAPPRVGEAVVAIGSPGVGGSILERSVVTGIVSAEPREIEGRRYLQTTAPINPGNSGGPLLSADGKLLGVVTAKAAGKEGIGFAVPVEVAQAFLGRREDAGVKVDGALADWEAKHGGPGRSGLALDKALPLPGAPSRLALDDDRLLALTPGDNALHVVSISERKLLKSVATGSDPVEMAPVPGSRSVWVANAGSRNLVRIDPERGAVMETVALTAPPRSMALTKSQIWFDAGEQGSLRVYSLSDKKEYTLIGVMPGPLGYDARRDRLMVGTRQGLVEFDPDRLTTLLKEMNRVRSLPNEARAVQEQITKTIRTYPGAGGGGGDYAQLLVHEKSAKLIYDRIVFRLDRPETQLGTLKPNPYSNSSNPRVKAFMDRYPFLDQVMAVSPDGKLAANGTHVFDLERFTVKLELPMPTSAAAFSKDSKTLWIYDFFNKSLVPFPLDGPK